MRNKSTIGLLKTWSLNHLKPWKLHWLPSAVTINQSHLFAVTFLLYFLQLSVGNGFSNVTFWHKLNIRDRTYRKLSNLKLFSNSLTLNLHQTPEKSFKRQVMSKRCFYRQLWTESLAKSKRIQAKLVKIKKMWYLLFGIFLEILPENHVSRGDWVLGCVPTKISYSHIS